MPRRVQKLIGGLARRYRRARPDAALIAEEIESISDYFAVFNSLLRAGDTFWFRGHADYTWSLTPSALRYSDEAQRNEALGLVTEFKRLGDIKLGKAPDPEDELKWLQLAQHYGLPTRLLDWTQNPAIALYFACLDPEAEGLVFILNPVDLNRAADPKRPRVFDSLLDRDKLAPYFRLSGKRNPRGRRTIAINPTWNSERIMLQQGTFTLHGAREFALTREQAESLAYLPIPGTVKNTLRSELERISVDEMSIFPELEHLCRQLKRRAGLLS